jgi:EAL domain-containing protein (putative c-di-GMP-specific phosphodiesterase class I)/GGDEF domain-containing protein
MWLEISQLMDEFTEPMAILTQGGDILAVNQSGRALLASSSTPAHLLDTKTIRLFFTGPHVPDSAADQLLFVRAPSGLRFTAGRFGWHEFLDSIHSHDLPAFLAWQDRADAPFSALHVRLEWQGNWREFKVQRVRKTGLEDSWLEILTAQPCPIRSQLVYAQDPLWNAQWFRLEVSRAVQAWREGSGADLFAVAMLELPRWPLLESRLSETSMNSIQGELRSRIAAFLNLEDRWGRFGPSCYGILLGNPRDRHTALARMNELLDLMNRPFRQEGSEFVLMARAGLAFPENLKVTCDSLLRDADTALEQARRRKQAFSTLDSPNSLSFADSELIEAGLRQALETEAISFEFQPVYEAASGRIAMIEALSRWRHPRLGEIAPSSFIQAAEDSGLVLQLDVNGLERLLAQIGLWQRNTRTVPGLVYTINMSSCHFPAFVHEKKVLSLLERELPPGVRLAFEVTESAVLAGDRVTIAHFQRLREAGVQIWLDDFGEGHSSLRYLVDYPVDGIKVSEFFVRRAADQPKAQAILSSIRKMADALGLGLVAEGVETREQWELLHSLGYRLLQGFYYSRALPAERLADVWELAWPGAANYSA